MEDTIDALEEAYLQLAAKEAVCRPRIDIRIPTSDPAKNYQWGTMEGGSTAGYFAIRMKSDIIYESEYNGVVTQEKYCTRPGLFCGLILLTSIENGEPLAFINDGHLQHMRVGADGGIGVKYMANEDAEVVGMLGSGGMARTHMQAFTRVRTIKKLQVFSPTKENREKFGREMAATYNIEVQVCDRPEDIYKGAHIVAALTDSALEVTDGSLLEKGAHIVVVGGTGRPGRCEPSEGRPLSALRRHAGAGRPSRACHRCRAHRLRGAAAGGETRRRPPQPPQARQRAAGPARHACRSGAGQGEGPHLRRPDHLFRARQPPGRAVLRGRRQGL